MTFTLHGLHNLQQFLAQQGAINELLTVLQPEVYAALHGLRFLRFRLRRKENVVLPSVRVGLKYSPESFRQERKYYSLGRKIRSINKAAKTAGARRHYPFKAQYMKYALRDYFHVPSSRVSARVVYRERLTDAKRKTYIMRGRIKEDAPWPCQVRRVQTPRHHRAPPHMRIQYRVQDIRNIRESRTPPVDKVVYDLRDYRPLSVFFRTPCLSWYCLNNSDSLTLSVTHIGTRLVYTDSLSGEKTQFVLI